MTQAPDSGMDTPPESRSEPTTEPAPEFFVFEADFVESLRCIPMQVRLKLDTCGIKLKLEHWHRLSDRDRQQLTQRPCDDSYGPYVQTLVQQVQGTPASTLPVEDNPAWHNGEAIPPAVVAQAAQVGVAIAIDQWRSLTPLQRFALIKLSRPSHENRNFYPALLEFALVPPQP